MAVVEVTGTDPDGEAVARPVDWAGDGPRPVVFMAAERRGQPALAPGQRVLARLRRVGRSKYEGRTFRRLADQPGRILGVFRRDAGGAGRITPTNHRHKAEWTVDEAGNGGAEPGEMVLAEPLPGRPFGLKPARVTRRLGRMDDPGVISTMCVVAHDIPDVFPPEALAEADAACAVSPDGRTDLRATPLVTIDGEDARDFDDAVFAERHGDGWRLLIAIADVAHYVPSGSALDRAAWERGNSVYFPDRVVPMLPEALSNGWCSLRPGEDRGCLFVEIHIDEHGTKLFHRFGRGLMCSAARHTYERAQAAADTLEFAALFGAFRALLSARRRRGALDMDLPERRVTLDGGKVVAVAPRIRLDSHRLIEEFMVLANICAAEELERLHQTFPYRVHAPPVDSGLENLRAVLRTLDLHLPPVGQLRPADLDRVLHAVRGTETAPLVNEAVLRSQSQAEYATANLGHFGLALPRYAHFTSPIRRYADLMVHRALLGGLTPAEVGRLPETAAQVTRTERRGATAEREATDRYLVSFLADRLGCEFAARISGVTRFGLFVTLTDSGATGFVPRSSLPDDEWMHHDAQTLSGRRSRVSFRVTQAVTVRLLELAPITAGLVFKIVLDPPHGLPQ